MVRAYFTVRPLPSTRSFCPYTAFVDTFLSDPYLWKHLVQPLWDPAYFIDIHLLLLEVGITHTNHLGTHGVGIVKLIETALTLLLSHAKVIAHGDSL